METDNFWCKQKTPINSITQFQYRNSFFGFYRSNDTYRKLLQNFLNRYPNSRVRRPRKVQILDGTIFTVLDQIIKNLVNRAVKKNRHMSHMICYPKINLLIPKRVETLTLMTKVPVLVIEIVNQKVDQIMLSRL